MDDSNEEIVNSSNESSAVGRRLLMASDDTDAIDKLVKDFRSREIKLEDELRVKDNLIRKL